MTEVLVLCTANICRSPMAEALLRSRLADLDLDVLVRSAGLLPGGFAPPPPAVAAMVPWGVDTSSHRSRQMEADMVSSPDLVVGMARLHVREAVVLVPESWPRAFTLKELVRRGEGSGPRAFDEPLASWLARVGEGRTRATLLGDDVDDDVEDPIGGPPAAYRATAAELKGLVDRLVEVAWAPEARALKMRLPLP